jgi:hypothetical protein
LGWQRVWCFAFRLLVGVGRVVRVVLGLVGLDRVVRVVDERIAFDKF